MVLSNGYPARVIDPISPVRPSGRVFLGNIGFGSGADISRRLQRMLAFILDDQVAEVSLEQAFTGEFREHVGARTRHGEDYADACATWTHGSRAWKCGITCSPKRRMVLSTSWCCAGPMAHSKNTSSMPRASYISRNRMQSAGVPTQNFAPCSRTSWGVGSPGCGPLARRWSRA